MSNKPDLELSFTYPIEGDPENKTNWVSGGAFWKSEDKPGLYSGHVIITVNDKAYKISAVVKPPRES